MRTALRSVVVRRGDQVVESETTVTPAGPHVLVFSTAMPSFGVLVTTTYVGAEDAYTVAVDLVLGPRPSATNRPRQIARDSLPVTHARERCLLDHARQVMNALREHDGRPYAVDVSDAAVAQAAAL